ncbi:MAG: hypothetical protein HY332_11535 [Chloroflexi bacterium]|nr:hypothetical protein [Chloroflexota bacterium]
MAKVEAGATLPVVRVVGTHADLGRAMGTAKAAQIQRAVDAAIETLREQGITDDELRREIEPFVDISERFFPEYVVELRAMARAAAVRFNVLFRLNCHESRPAAPPRPAAPTVPEEPAVPTKDPDALAAAEEPAGAREALETHAGDGCTSVVSRGEQGVVVGHTEDSYSSAVVGLYLLDATVTEPTAATGAARSHLIGLNYAQTLPGCAAAANEHGLVILIDALPDAERVIGVPRHLVSRALLDLPSIDAAIDLLRTLPRGGGWNYVLVQGQRVVNVETTATKVVVTEVGDGGTLAHTNHYVDPALVASSGEPRPNSLARLARALELVLPGMSVPDMKALLRDRQGFPDSICRERTIGAFVADTAERRIEACWGEPDSGAWAVYSY